MEQGVEPLGVARAMRVSEEHLHGKGKQDRSGKDRNYVVERVKLDLRNCQPRR